MGTKPPRRIAMDFIAAYEHDSADPGSRIIVRVARRWLQVIGSRHTTQGVVNSILRELDRPEGEDYGCGWQDLRKHFLAWAMREEWLEADGRSKPRRSAGTRRRA